jgi:hypothetical protein
MNKQTKPRKRKPAAQEEPRIRIIDNGLAYGDGGILLGNWDEATGLVKSKPRYERVQGILVMGRKAQPRTARKTAKRCRVLEFPC